MAESIETEFAVKYRVIPLHKNKYILFPVEVERGELCGYDFVTDKNMIPILNRKKALNEKYVIGPVYTTDELRLLYGDFEDGKPDEELDEEFLKKYHYADSKEKLIYVETNDDKEITGTLTIDLAVMQQPEEIATYSYNKDVAAVILNEDALDALLKTVDIKEIKLLLKKYRKLVESFKEYHDNDGITKVRVKNGKIEQIDTGATITELENIQPITNIDVAISTKKDSPLRTDFTYQGLRDAIKEYVFGQDEAIDTFAQKLFMNVTAEPGEPVESILFVGPTGVGKTETVEAAARYLQIPYFPYNASNLNAEGIVGTSIENVLTSLYEMAGGDLARAQRGIVFFDEFDKLNDSDLNTKTIIRNILLTFNGGGKFPIVKGEKVCYTFDTSMTNKIYAGVFQRIADTKRKTIGFGEQQQFSDLSESDIRKRIIDKNYFTLEELSRISTILPFYELDRDTKIRILKESKLSTLAQKKRRYKRQFGLDIDLSDDFVDAVIEKLDNSETGMRSLNNVLKQILDCAEKQIILEPNKKYKTLVLTKKTVNDPTEFDLL